MPWNRSFCLIRLPLICFGFCEIEFNMLHAKRSRKLLIYISIFCSIFVSTAGFGNSLLCIGIGENGHIGIEVVDQCGSQRSAGEQKITFGLEEHSQDGCGACIDIPLAGPFLETSARASCSSTVVSAMPVPQGYSIDRIDAIFLSSHHPDNPDNHISAPLISVLRI